VQEDHIRTGDGAKRPVSHVVDPRHAGPVVEAQNQFHAQADPSPITADHTDDVGIAPPGRHEVDHGDRATGGLETGFQDERVGAVAADRPHVVVNRRNQPAPVLRSAEERGEAGAGIEPRPAQPIDRPMPRHQGRGFAVADEGVVFERRAHAASRNAITAGPTRSIVQSKRPGSSSERHLLGRAYRTLHSLRRVGEKRGLHLAIADFCRGCRVNQ
jgi:hypothetical protein